MLEQTLRNTFGMNCHIELFKLKGLPLYMTSGRKFFKATMGEVSFMIIELFGKDKFGVTALKKQLAQYVDNTGLNSAYLFENVTRTQRNSLIANEIPFVALPDQIYLPFLGVVLNNSFKKKTVVTADKMTPATQCLFLYMLYRGGEDYTIKKRAADDLGLTKTSITRASVQLKKLNLIHEEYAGKEIRMIAKAKGYEFFELAKDYLINPVQKVIHSELYSKTGIYIAGETMLSRHSMLSEPKERTYAVYKGDAVAGELKDIDIRWQEDIQTFRIELWKYNPAIFAANGEVDPVSLAMSLSDNTDERVEGELKTYLEGYKW